MRITMIRFRRLASNREGYGHVAIEAEATVGEAVDPDGDIVEVGESAEGAIDDLAKWVDGQVATRLGRFPPEAEAVAAAPDPVKTARFSLLCNIVEAELDAHGGKMPATRDALRKHIDEILDDLIPF